MASLYLCDVAGDGLSLATAFHPAVTTNSVFSCLMIDTNRMKALILCADDTLSGTGITRLVQAASVAALKTKAATTSPTAAQRTAVNTWLSNGGYQQLTTQTTWFECAQFVAQQVNPAADLNVAAI